MSNYDEEFYADRELGHLDDESVEAKVWQLLLLINPDDEELALQQFTDYREAVAEDEALADEPVGLIGHVIDWRSGFMVDANDLRSLVQAIDELCSRWNLSIDWAGDPHEDEFFEDMDAASLFSIAYDSLAGFGYTLWSWETEGDRHAGWMTLTRDAEPMRELATQLGINLRLGSELS